MTQKLDVVSVTIDKRTKTHDVPEIVKEEPKPITEAARERLEAALSNAVKEYIKDIYPQMQDDWAGEAAALAYHFWDDVQDEVPEFVKQIWEEHTPE